MFQSFVPTISFFYIQYIIIIIIINLFIFLDAIKLVKNVLFGAKKIVGTHIVENINIKAPILLFKKLFFA